MDKKEAKMQYMRMRLADPDVDEREKDFIRERLGIIDTVTEEDFRNRHGDELLGFVSNYLDGQMKAIRRRKQTNDPFEFFSDNLKAVYYLSVYDSYFEEDTLEQIHDTDSEGDYIYLSECFELIGRMDEATLLKSVFKVGAKEKTITGEEIEKLQEHFLESDNKVQEINRAIEQFILSNISDLIHLQTL